jgi:uncharacterized membrane protein YdbT with pleckstrin-like domain
MSSPAKQLNPGEEVALDLRPHWWFFSKHILTGLPLLVLVVLVLQLGDGGFESAAKWLAGLLVVAWLVWLGLQYVSWTMTNFVVTSQRVIYRTGVLRRRGVEIPLTRISNINFDQGLWERVIGAGDLVIESAGEQGQSRFTDVQHPDAVQQEVYRRMEGEARRQASFQSEGIAEAVERATAAPGPPAADVPDQIRKLAELRDAGAISADEYERKKAELLERM